MKITKNFLLSFLSLIVLLYITLPWLSRGIIMTDDLLAHHINRLWFLQETIVKQNEFYEWMPHIYYGWPVFHFYHPLSYFITLPLLYFLSPIDAIKVSTAISIMASFLSMYFAVNMLFKNKTVAILSSLFYTLAPIHFEVLNIAGSFSRAWAYVFLPISFATFVQMIEEKSIKKTIIAGFFFSVVMLSHLNFAYSFLFLPFLFFIFYFFNSKDKIKVIKVIIFFGLIIIGITSFWLIPLILEKDESGLEGAINSKNIFFDKSVGSTNWQSALIRDFGRFRYGNSHYASFYLGYSLLIFSVLSFVFYRKLKYCLFLGISFFIFFILMLNQYFPINPVIFIPFSKLLFNTEYFGLNLAIISSILSGLFIYNFSYKKNTLLSFIIILFFSMIVVIDIIPAAKTFVLFKGDYNNLNDPNIMNAWNFIKNQDNYFRVMSIVGQNPWMFHSKQEMGYGWMIYPEGALSPIKKINDFLYLNFKENPLDINTNKFIGFLGIKYYVTPCIKIKNTAFKEVFISNNICVYENNYFDDLVKAPKNIIMNKNYNFSLDGFYNDAAIALEECEVECLINNSFVNISNVKWDYERISFETDSLNEAYILVKTAYFKQHWNVYINHKKIETRMAWPRFILIKIPQGRNHVVLNYETNNFHRISKYFSLITFIILFYLLFRKEDYFI